jgi:hypothetical protein
VIKDITEEAEAKLAVEVLAAQTLRQEKDVLLKEATEVSTTAVVGNCELIDLSSSPSPCRTALCAKKRNTQDY